MIPTTPKLASPTAPRQALPPSIDADDFARGHRRCAGEIAAIQLERVAPELVNSEGVLRWSVAGEPWRDPQGRDRPRLHLQAEGRLVIACTRCLGPLTQVVGIDRWAALAPDENRAEQEDLEADDYDVVLSSQHFSLNQWLEDEVLLELFKDPRHANCELPDHLRSDSLSPFAALEQLKKRDA